MFSMPLLAQLEIINSYLIGAISYYIFVAHIFCLQLLFVALSRVSLTILIVIGYAFLISHAHYEHTMERFQVDIVYEWCG